MTIQMKIIMAVIIEIRTTMKHLSTPKRTIQMWKCDFGFLLFIAKIQDLFAKYECIFQLHKQKDFWRSTAFTRIKDALMRLLQRKRLSLTPPSS